MVFMESLNHVLEGFGTEPGDRHAISLGNVLEGHVLLDRHIDLEGDVAVAHAARFSGDLTNNTPAVLTCASY